VNFIKQETFRITKQDFIYSSIYYDVIFDVLHANELVSENNLAEKFGCSRTPVREAIGKLIQDNILVSIPQQGTYVTPIKIENADEAIFVRSLIEPTILVKAIDHITDKDLLELKKIIDDHESFYKKEDFVSSFVMDIKFHEYFYKICNYQKTFDSIERISSDSYRIRFLKLKNNYRWDGTLNEHLHLLNLIVDKNRDELYENVLQHILNCYVDTKSLLEKYSDYFVTKH
jgi:DNA-binding GntR family transcriptional regulator